MTFKNIYDKVINLFKNIRQEALLLRRALTQVKEVKMDKYEARAMFEQALEQLLSADDNTREMAATMVIGMYDQLVGQYRSLIPLVSELLKKAADDLASILKILPAMVNDISTNPEFRETMRAIQDAKAESRHSMLNKYEEAGFTRTEAMEMILCDSSAQRTALMNTVKTMSSYPTRNQTSED